VLPKTPGLIAGLEDQPVTFASADGYPWLFSITLKQAVSLVGVGADLAQLVS
jgi:hypothetical protein